MKVLEMTFPFRIRKLKKISLKFHPPRKDPIQMKSLENSQAAPTPKKPTLNSFNRINYYILQLTIDFPSASFPTAEELMGLRYFFFHHFDYFPVRFFCFFYKININIIYFLGRRNPVMISKERSLDKNPPNMLTTSSKNKSNIQRQD